MSDSWSGINDEYELTEWESEDSKWIRLGPSSWELRLPIDSLQADNLMREKLKERGGLDAKLPNRSKTNRR